MWGTASLSNTAVQEDQSKQLRSKNDLKVCTAKDDLEKNSIRSCIAIHSHSNRFTGQQ